MRKTNKAFISKKKTKDDLSAYPLHVQMGIVIDRMKEQKIDPLDTLIHILDPNHDHIVKPTLKPDPRIPVDASKGVFRVIYSELQGKRWKMRTEDVEASDGYDAVTRFLCIDDNIMREDRREIIVSGMECVILPSKTLRKFREDWYGAQLDNGINTLMEAAKVSLVTELEQFEDESKTISLEDFAVDSNL